MKKIMTIVALAAMTMGIASCSDENPVSEDKFSFGVTDLMTKTVTGDNFFDYAGSKLRFDLNFLADTACLQVLNTKFVEQMPVTVNLLLDKTKIEYTDRDRFTLTGSNYNVMEGYTVNNVRCKADISHKTYYLTYEVVTPRATSRVYVYPKSILTALADDDINYASTNELYLTLDCSKNSEGNYEGKVGLNNVQFSIGESTSPKFKRITIPYDENVTITGTKTGYIVEGTGITGLYLQGSTEVPFDQSTIDNLKIEVDVVNKNYSIFFNCMGGEFSCNGKLYL